LESFELFVGCFVGMKDIDDVSMSWIIRVWELMFEKIWG
jgi:hypothetical protein